MKITLTREEIKNGRAGEPGSCPIALALNKKKGFTYVSVGWGDIWAYRDGLAVIAKTPEIVRKFISRFDTASNPHRVMPISFELKFKRRT